MLILIKFFKFIAVGFSGLVVDFGLTFLFKEKFYINKYISNSIGFTFAATSNYFLNRIWTFSSKNPDVIIEFSSFFLIAVIGLIINNTVLWLAHEKVKNQFYYSKFTAIIITTLWNFFGNYFYTFNI